MVTLFCISNTSGNCPGALSKHDANGQKLNPKDHVHVYCRFLEGMPLDISAKDFFDWNSSLDQAVPGASQRMQNLKNQLRRQLGDHYHELKLKPESSWKRWRGGRSLSATFLRSVFKTNRFGDAEVAAFERIDDRQQREHLHQDFGDERARVFAGRKALLAKIVRYTDADSPSRMGKQNQGPRNLLH